MIDFYIRILLITFILEIISTLYYFAKNEIPERTTASMALNVLMMLIFLLWGVYIS